MSYKDAVRFARSAIETLKKQCRTKDTDDIDVLFPLGLERRRAMPYKFIKDSAFVFRTPAQRNAVLKALKKFEEKCGCGLEILALRQTRNDRRQGSLCDVASRIYQFIREGGDNITKAMNLNRSFPGLERVIRTHLVNLKTRRKQLYDILVSRIDGRNLPVSGRLTGLMVGEQHQILVE